MPVVKIVLGPKHKPSLPGKRGGRPIWLSGPFYIFVSFVSGVVGRR